RIVDLQCRERVGGNLLVDDAVACQRLQDADGDGFGIDLEEASCRIARVGETESVGAQRLPVSWHPARDVVGYRALIIAHGQVDDVIAGQDLADVRDERFLLWMVEVVFFDVNGFACQLVPRGHRPHFYPDAVVFEQHVASLDGPRHGHTRGQDARGGAVAFGGGQIAVRAAQHPVDVYVLGFGWLDDRLVVDGQVVDDVFAVRVSVGGPVHAP